ncbi:MAG: GspH/FimT family pseudopilin [Pseudomonadota bacterium]
MKYSNGLTIFELMIVLAVASILLSVGVPSFRGVMMDNRLVSDTNQFVASISLARSSAVRFQRDATICVSANTSATVPTCTASTDWSQGWMVWVDKNRDAITTADEVVSVFAPLNDSLSFTAANVNRFTYDSRGFGSTPADDLTLCDNRSGESGRVIKVNAIGRTSVVKQGCS